MQRLPGASGWGLVGAIFKVRWFDLVGLLDSLQLSFALVIVLTYLHRSKAYGESVPEEGRESHKSHRR